MANRSLRVLANPRRAALAIFADIEAKGLSGTNPPARLELSPKLRKCYRF
jgi:hypothetical protein